MCRQHSMTGLRAAKDFPMGNGVGRGRFHLRGVRLNESVEWTHNGGQRGRQSSMLSAPSGPIHGQRYVASTQSRG